MDEVVSLLRILDWIRKQGGDVSQRLESTPKPPRPVGIVSYGLTVPSWVHHLPCSSLVPGFHS